MATVDLRIQNKCDHRIQGEILALQADKRTLIPSYEVASEGSIQVLRYGDMLPQEYYSFVNIASAIEGSERKVIRLSKKDNTLRPLYTLNYVTQKDTCPKCLGTDYTDDITTDSNGQYKRVDNLSLLAQNVEKHIITDSNSNKFHSWIGNQLRSLIGKKNVDVNAVETEIKNQIRNGLSKFKNAQIEQSDANPQVGLDEQLGEVTSIEVSQDDRDPTVFYVEVSYTSLSGRAVQFNTLVDLNNFRER
jgi:hypothetical protein